MSIVLGIVQESKDAGFFGELVESPSVEQA